VTDLNRQQYTFSLNAEQLSFGSLVLPEVEDAETPRVLFEERITLLRDFCKAFDALFDTFLKTRASSAWEGQRGDIRKWIMQGNKPVAAVA
jgi:hypothetical protein